VYSGGRCNSISELKAKIETNSSLISEDIMLNVIRGVENCLRVCLTQIGGIFENLI
jgi:hypothetical protein